MFEIYDQLSALSLCNYTLFRRRCLCAVPSELIAQYVINYALPTKHGREYTKGITKTKKEALVTTVMSTVSPGYSAGYCAGYSAGYCAGYSAGYSVGYSAGYSAGYYAGSSAIYSVGYSAGYYCDVPPTTINDLSLKMSIDNNHIMLYPLRDQSTSNVSLDHSTNTQMCDSQRYKTLG